MKYTKISQSEEDTFKLKMENAYPGGTKLNMARIKTLSKEDPSIFAKFYLGIEPFVYQDKVLNDNSKRIIVCSSRQIGKTYVTAIRALHYAMFNEDSSILVFSRNNNQSKKFLREMKNIMQLGMDNLKHTMDKQPSTYWDEPGPWIFPQNIDKKKPNNTEEFSLTNGSIIRSLPATDSSRGYTADLVIVDEAAFVQDEIFEMVIEPTVRFTGGSIILLSTPNGQKCYFYHLFDPLDKREENDYSRYWWKWELCPNENIKKMTEKKRKVLDPMRFAQEYEAQFTVDADSFFQSRKIREATRPDLQLKYADLENHYVCGVDYGVINSKTVVSLSYFDERDSTVYLAYQKEFPGGYDNAQLPRFLEELETKFNIIHYVVDDCPQGESPTQALERVGKKVRRVYFGKEKVGMYFRFKEGINMRDDDEGFGRKVRFPKLKKLIEEMNALQMRDSKRGLTYLIEKPQGGSDDRIDSFVLSTMPFLEEELREFKSYIA
mgnify:CR=1 FL=1|jgi:hypothetical protein|tara:strand:- start:531 stop:2003 length:1473 start_codon:yes stop_codon:yes gene_type:complete